MGDNVGKVVPLERAHEPASIVNADTPAPFVGID